MPNKHTFTIKPIKILVESTINKYRTMNKKTVIIDPFANNSKIATITNDLDPIYDTDYHMDALEFLKIFPDCSVDIILYDPPYTPRQVSESYTKLGYTVNMETTQTSYWTKQKKEISRVVKPKGIVISCGYNTNGIGKKLGFHINEILLVAHGGDHNDTMVTVEEKEKTKQTHLTNYLN